MMRRMRETSLSWPVDALSVKSSPAQRKFHLSRCGARPRRPEHDFAFPARGKEVEHEIDRGFLGPARGVGEIHGLSESRNPFVELGKGFLETGMQGLSRGHEGKAVGGELGIQGFEEIARAFLERRVPLFQDAFVRSQGIDIRKRKQAGALVEEKTPPLGVARREGKVLVAENHGRAVEDELLPVLQLLAVETDVLGRALDADRNPLIRRSGRRPACPLGLKPETRASGRGDLGVHKAAEGGAVAEVVQGFEKIRLSLAVFADEKHSFGVDRHFGVFEISIRNEARALEWHQSICIGMTM